MLLKFYCGSGDLMMQILVLLKSLQTVTVLSDPSEEGGQQRTCLCMQILRVMLIVRECN